MKSSGNLIELVDPRLNSNYDIQEMMVVIILALSCTMNSLANRPTVSSVLCMLEERIVPKAFAFKQTVSMTEIDHEKMLKPLKNMNESQIEEM